VSCAGVDAADSSHFYYPVELGADDDLYVHGRRLQGSVAFSFDGEVLSVNGIRIAAEPFVASDSLLSGRARELEDAFTGNALFDSCMAGGGGVRPCVRLFEERFSRMTDRMSERWRRFSDEYDLRADSSRPWRVFSDSVLVALDSMIVGDLAVARARTSVSPSGVVVFTTLGGRLPSTGASLSRAGEPNRTGRTREEEALAQVRLYAAAFAGQGPALAIISRAGALVATGADASRLREEIDMLLLDLSSTPRILSVDQARELRSCPAVLDERLDSPQGIAEPETLR
jgi:hypothetical protein